MSDLSTSGALAAPDMVSVIVYSEDASVRRDIISAVGRRAAPGIAEIEWKEVATPDAVRYEVEEGDYSLMILDAEAPKLGGMGLGKMIHDELDEDLPFILYIARPQDEWLARWSGAAKILSFPVAPRELSAAVADILSNGNNA